MQSVPTPKEAILVLADQDTLAILMSTATTSMSALLTGESVEEKPPVGTHLAPSNALV